MTEIWRGDCKHEWVRTGSMAPGEARCIQCGQWATTNARISKPLIPEQINYLIQLCTQSRRLEGSWKDDISAFDTKVDLHRLVHEVEKLHGVGNANQEH